MIYSKVIISANLFPSMDKKRFEKHWRELHAENAEGYTPMALAHREGDWNNMRFFLNYQVNSPRQQLHRELLSLSRFE